MSINGSIQELILKLYLIEFKILEKVLGLELKFYEVEKNSGANKVDVTAFCPIFGIEIMAECQVNKSDQRHLEIVLDLIDSNKEAIIIWIASAFHNVHLEEVRNHLSKNKRKYINFYAFEVNHTALQTINELNELEKNDILTNLHLLTDEDTPTLNLVSFFEQIPNNHIGSAYAHEKQFDVEITSERNQYICQELRRLIPNEINLILKKKPSKNSRMISIGAGKDGLTFMISSEAIRGNAVVLIHFANHRQEEYEMLRNQMHILREKVHPNIKVIVDRQIGVQFKPSLILDDTIKILAEILEKLMQFCFPQFDKSNRLRRKINA